MAALKWLDENLERCLVSVLLAAIVLLITGNVIMRYVFNASLSWGEELTLWFFVWFIWLAVSQAFHKREHIRITVFRDLLPAGAGKAINVIVDVLVLVFFAVLIKELIALINQPFVASQKSVVLGLPIPILYSSALAGSALSSFRIIQHLVRTLRPIPCATESEVKS